ncbi:hypothetical protein LKM28_27390 [Streptomyces sp. CT1-17]|uniref:hypothetical protein n=1 Tax=unclassified Streptomyces TaxID=2593676 RepID=UPI0014137DF6|nr:MULTISPECIES: hypothetical protein [unclassified Streptomyces]MCC2270007.1 hypothetical protein [Streptomyces sp. CT1-17]QIP73590.1 hypothetical protein EZV63_30275 [Streptomyces sp. VN1]
MDYDAAANEYKKAAAELNLPKGAEGFPGLPKPAEATQYQKGVGLVQAQYHWQCTWEKEWLTSQEEGGTRADTALAELEKAPKMKYMSKEHLDDQGRSDFLAYLDRAKLGDPSGFQMDYTANCQRPEQN